MALSIGARRTLRAGLKGRQSAQYSFVRGCEMPIDCAVCIQLHISKSNRGIIVVTQGLYICFVQMQHSLSQSHKYKERTMMTQPIQTFQNLTSETRGGGKRSHQARLFVR